MTVKITYDCEADAAYVTVGERVAPGTAVRQVGPIASPDGEAEVVLDFDAAGHLLGVEVLGASRALTAEVLAAADQF